MNVERRARTGRRGRGRGRAVVLEVESEGRKGPRRAEPDEPVGPRLEARRELVGVPVPQDAAHAVRGDDHIRGAERGGIGHFDAEAEIHLQFTGSASQDVQQGLVVRPAKPCPVEAMTEPR